MIGMRLPLLFFVFFLLAGGGALAHAYNFTLPRGAPSNFSATFNSTLSYISTVNRSAYLVFYPNLTAAYGELYMARENYSTDAPLAYSHIANARTDAASQLARIDSYRPLALGAMVVLSAAAAAWLYVVMRRYRGVAKGRKRVR